MKYSASLPLSCLIMAATVSCYPALAAGNPAAHSHGVAGMQIAVEGNTVEVMFQSPAFNLVGFEHEPKNTTQRQAIRDARKWLDSSPLVDTVTPSCRVVEASVTDSFGPGHMPEHHAGHGKQDEHHGHAGEKHHGHHDDQKDETHSEFSVTQQLLCGNLTGSGSQTLTVPLVSHFPAIEVLTLEWVSSASQGSARLESADPTFRLTQ